MERVAIVVAGMHRSGTSALTRMLASLGCALPKTLMPANEYNVAGYWESEEVASLNDALLQSAGSSWDDWEPLNPGWYKSPAAADFQSRARSVLEAEFEDESLFVVKDPRIARLLPFWTEALAEYGADVRIALPVRNPLEVAGSLQTRDAIDPSIGLLLWLRHILDAEAASRDHRRTFVRFEDLLRDWEAVAVTVARDLELSWPRQSTSARVDIEERLEPSARHQVADDAAALERPEVSEWVASTFGIVDRWAHGEVRESDGDALDAVRSAFDAASRAFARPLVKGMRAGQRNRGLEKEVRALHEVVTDRENQIDSLNRAITDRDENVAYLDGVVRAKDAELDKLGATVSARDVEIDALQHVVAGRDGEIVALKDAVEREAAERDREIASRNAEIDALQHTVAGRDGEIATLRDTLDRQALDRDREVASRDAEIAELATALEDRDHRVDALTRDRDRQIETLKVAVEQRDALRQTAEDRQGQIDAMHEVLDDRDRELATVYGSTSWRLTAPLRKAKALLLGAGRTVTLGWAWAARGILRVTWRTLPLPGSTRARLKRTTIGSFAFLGPLARSSGHQPLSPVKYISSGWLDLADLHYEARRNGTDLPILFDPDWYLETYPDIRAAGLDPLAHYLRHGAVEGRWPVELEAGEVDPVIEGLHRLDLAAEDAHTLDAGFLRVLYPELAGLRDAELALVCTGNGARVGSKAAFVSELCQSPREIPLDFDASEYIRLYPDLRFLAEQSPLEALRHYMCHGRFEPRLHTLRTDPTGPRVDEEPVDTAPVATGPRRPLCVLAHVYYPELWDELADYLGNLPSEGFDLYVNLVDETFDGELLGRMRVAFPDAQVYVSENVGRDIGGHFQLLRNLRREDYTVFCLVHTKKSPHMAEGEVQRWRRRLLEPLLGTRARVDENLRIMLEDETIGVLGSAGCRFTEINANREKYDALLDRLGISERPDELEFLSGTMMFLRGDLLGRIFDAAQDLTFEPSDARTADGDPDGAWAHAVERAFGAVARDMGYRFEWR
ncbi:MAG: hypothetical protein F4X99_04135 [Gammaproteobacteria bacterium]|nr:hypothetical protein [Gammaproteobacteria bacterium]